MQVQTLRFTQTARSPTGACSAATGGCGRRWRCCAGTARSAGTCHTGPGGRACPRPWGEVSKGSREQASPESLLGSWLGSQGRGRDKKESNLWSLPSHPSYHPPVISHLRLHCFLFKTNQFLLPACCLLESLPTPGLSLWGTGLFCHALRAPVCVILLLKVISVSPLSFVTLSAKHAAKIPLCLISLPLPGFPQHWENGSKSPTPLFLPLPSNQTTHFPLGTYFPFHPSYFHCHKIWVLHITKTGQKRMP